MRIDHSAMYVEHLEREKAFFEEYFNAEAGELYHNLKPVSDHTFFPSVKEADLKS